MSKDSTDPMSAARNLIRAIGNASGTPGVMLTWKGSKVARGELFNGSRIGWMQHGRIISTDGVELGIYERLEEFAGPENDRHTVVAHASDTRP